MTDPRRLSASTRRKSPLYFLFYFVPHDADNMFCEKAVIGVNGWVARRNENVFDGKVDVLCPERWLGDSELVDKREAYFMTVRLSSIIAFALAALCSFLLADNLEWILRLVLVQHQSDGDQGYYSTIVRHFDFLNKCGTPSWRNENVVFVWPEISCLPIGWLIYFMKTQLRGTLCAASFQ